MAVADPQMSGPPTSFASEPWAGQHVQDPSPKKRQDFSRENTDENFENKLGDYILGQTLGAGEFGKVKLGWKKPAAGVSSTNTLQVAIKMIKRRKLDTSSRMNKVYREINILRELEHPNIVRLHDVVETDDTMGIILEYASGGELFDYILHHRYLKDPSARRLFAQLISGVGYLHKKGIIHRDLKLENLLLDRNKNIIITDFGFANQFDPLDSLPDSIEKNLHKRDWVQANGLDKPGKNGWRRGDLMATSCGSPCYAAPELVVSDGLYHGRKVDVWSCGVILYAMLAGYLPFDDDPKNPDGDNINALYQYITNTELIFPDYVTPHARDLLRRILVPDPRKRADLFEVARHSWLSDFSSQLESVTSTVDLAPINSIKASSGVDGQAPPPLARSASVRETSKPSSSPSSHAPNFPSRTAAAAENVLAQAAQNSRDTKRRTLQFEYVAPQNPTQRSPREGPYQYASSSTRPRTQDNAARETRPEPPPKDDPAGVGKGRAPPPVRPARDHPRSTSDSTAFSSSQYPSRPATQGSMTGSRLPPSRGSYGQPSSAAITTTNALGQVSMPSKTSSGQQKYAISDPVPHGEAASSAFSGNAAVAGGFGQRKQINSATHPARGHKRSSTLGGLGEKLLGRSGSVSKRETNRPPPRTDRAYPPTSMKPLPFNEQNSNDGSFNPRSSVESKRSGAFGKKSSFDAGSEQYSQGGRSSRRFSWFDKLRPRSSRDMSNWSREDNASRDSNFARQQQLWQQASTSTNATQSTQTGAAGGRNIIRRSISRLRESIDGGNRGGSSGGGGVGGGALSQPTQMMPQQHQQQQDQYGFKPHRRFEEEYSGSKKQQSAAGSSGAARRVMDYFRRRKQPSSSSEAEYWNNDG